MQIWTTWLDALRAILGFLSSDIGLGMGLSIVLVTLCVRILLLPVSWRCAYAACLRQKRVRRVRAGAIEL